MLARGSGSGGRKLGRSFGVRCVFSFFRSKAGPGTPGTGASGTGRPGMRRAREKAESESSNSLESRSGGPLGA